VTQSLDGVLLIPAGGDETILLSDDGVELTSQLVVLGLGVQPMDGTEHSAGDQGQQHGEPFLSHVVLGVVGVDRCGGDGGHQVSEVEQLFVEESGSILEGCHRLGEVLESWIDNFTNEAAVKVLVVEVIGRPLGVQELEEEVLVEGKGGVVVVDQGTESGQVEWESDVQVGDGSGNTPNVFKDNVLSVERGEEEEKEKEKEKG